MARKTLSEEIAINAALENFILTRACLTDVNIYMSPDAVVIELEKMGIEITARTVATRYAENNIKYNGYLWTRPVEQY